MSEDLYREATRVPVEEGSHPACVRVARFAGATSSRRFLLVHGNPSDLTHWGPLLPALRGLGDILAYDQVGFGRSDALTTDAPTLERCADVAACVLDAAGWREPVTVVGQSHGGMVAIALAARFPERVTCVVLLGTGGTPAHLAYRLLALPHAATVLELLAKRLFGSTMLEPLARRIIHHGLRRAFAPDIVPDAVAVETTRLFAARPALAASMARLVEDDPCTKVAAYARQVRAPLLFVHGRSDALVPIDHARRLHDIALRAGQRSTFIEVDGGHFLHHTHPGLVMRHLTRWLHHVDGP